MPNKRILIYLIIIIVSVVFLTGCGRQNKLLILNWGEYINDEIVELFEEEFNCTVDISIAESNELFYAKVKSGTTAYDLVIPSDYMIEKMYQKNMLTKLDLTKIPNYRPDIFLPGVIGIESGMFKGNENYQIPYFWGTFGLMYNKNKEGLEEIIINKGWDAFFNGSLLPSGTKVGMYNVPRFAYAASMFYNNLSPNLVGEEYLNIFANTLSLRKFTEWGTDTLKKGIEAGNLDLAFVYTGDCLDMLYEKFDDGYFIEDISFDIFIPDNTIAFMDSLVMPKSARHIDLAYEFMNFMLRPEIAYLNASVVGYCTPLIASYNQIVNYSGDDEWCNNWAYAINKYYPLPKESDLIKFKGTPLANVDKDYLTKLTNIVNRIKAGV